MSLLDKYIAATDSIRRGFTARGIANGLPITRGFSFPRIAGGYNLYRGKDSLDAIDWVNPVGAASADANELRNFSWMGHDANTRYVYGVRAISGGGVEEGPDPGDPEARDAIPAQTHNVIRASFDGGGALRPPEPNAPANLAVFPAAGGTLRVAWTYSAAGQDAAPVSFAVHDNGGAGAVNFDTPIGTVTYKPGQVFFGFVTGSYANGTRVELGVRARSASSAFEANTVTQGAVAVATPPPALTALLVSEGSES